MDTLYILGILGFLCVFTSASYDYSNIISIDPLDQELHHGHESLHHRSKRAAVIPTSPLNPNNVTFYLFKMGEHENVTSMSVGSHVRFQLVIHFPQTTTDMLVELFTPDNASTIMKLCHPEVMYKGSKLDVKINNVVQTVVQLNAAIKKEGKTANTKDYDRAIIELGNVTNNGASGTNDESMIKIEWEAIMIANTALVNGSIYWVSAGAEYNLDSEVWVGQASFVAVEDNFTPTENPAGNATGPDEMQIGSSGSFKVDLYIPYPSVALTFDAFAPLNYSGVMSVCSIAITGTGKNYDCLDKEKNFTTYPAANSRGNERGRLVIGTVTNKDARKNILADGKITVEFVMYMFDDPSFVGNTYWVGAAVEIGTTKIWAGQLSVKAIAKANNETMTADPTFVSFINGSSTAAVGDTVVMGINMTVPDNQPGDYELEILAPYNDSAPQMRICKVMTVFHGSNVPCISDSKPVYKARDNNTERCDQAKWSLGKITNFGHIAESNSHKTPDVMTFSIAAELLDHGRNTPGAQVWLTGGMMFTKQKLWIGQNAVTLGTPTNTSSSPPTMSMYFRNSSDTLWINESGLVYLEIQTAPGSIYRPMDMEFILPFENNTAMMTFCKVEIIYVGGNYPCFDQKKFNATFNYTSKANDDKKPDKVMITLGQISNLGLSADTKENKIIFAFSFKVQDHIGLVEGAQRWVSVGLMYGPITIWVGQLQVTAKRTGAGPTSAAPHIDIIREDDPGHTNVPLGGIVEYDVIIKVPPTSSSKYIIEVTGTAAMKVCLIRLMEFGTNLPCCRDDLNSTIDGTKTTLDLSVVSNLAEEDVATNATFDNNTLRVKVIMQMSMTATLASTHAPVLKVDNGANVGWATPTMPTLTAIAAVAQNSSNATNPAFSFNVHDADNNETTPSTHNRMFKGESKLFRLDIRPKPKTVNKLQVKFLTPVNSSGQMEICAINVLHVGLNMPCNKREVYNGTGTFASRFNSPFQDIAGISLGYICYRQLFNDSEEEKITVEAVVKMLPNNSMTADFFMSATVMINDDQIYVTQMKMSVGNIADFNDTSPLNTTMAAIKMVEPADILLSWRPGSVATFQFYAEFPPNSSSKSTIQVSTKMATTAVMTMKNFKILRAGQNIGCIWGNRTEGEYPMSLNSTVKSTQKDRAYMDLGIITNSGVSERTMSITEEDNRIYFEGEIQMADALVNVGSSIHKLLFGAKMGEAILTYEKNIAVSRNGAEEPKLRLNVTGNDTITYTKGVPLEIESILYHEIDSSAEAYNVSTNFYFPKMLKFLGLVYCNHSTPTIENITTPANGVRIKFDKILFTDAANFLFKLALDENVATPPVLGVAPDATIPYEAASYKIHRAIDNFASGNVFLNRMDSLSFKMELPAGAGCVMGPLGIGNGRITDCQLESSYSPSATDAAKMARMGGAGKWTAAARGSHYEKYVLINFGNMTRVTRLALEHPGNDRVTRYQVSYSDDGHNFKTGEIITPAANYGTTVNNLTTPQDARYLKVNILDNAGGEDGTVSVRMEAYGCTTLGDVSISDLCKAKPWDSLTQATDFVRRGFLATSSTFYYCDAVSSNDEKMKCFSSADSTTWKSIDQEVINVIGFLPSKGELYGIAKDRRSYVMSDDSGTTWSTIAKSRFDKMKTETGFLPGMKADWVLDTTVSDPPSVTLTSGSWKAGFKGVFYGANQVADWTKCCA